MPEDFCIRRVMAAAALEQQGIELDRAGDNQGAILKYEECLVELTAAVRSALPAHVADQPRLAEHKCDICDRVAHLKSMKGEPASIPVEEQIRPVQLHMQTSSAAADTVSSAGGVKTLASCAAMGAGAGVVILGSTVGAPLALVGGAAGAAYLATRKDKSGEAARTAGGAGLVAASKAKELSERHGLTEKLAVAGRAAGAAGLSAAAKAKELDERHQVTDKVAAAGKGAWVKAKETDGKYGITSKIGAGVGAAVAKGKELEQRHHVTEKVGAGLSRGFSKLSQAMSSRGSSHGGA